MNIVDRFEGAFASDIGYLFLGLVGFLVILGFVYWYLLYRKKKADKFAYLFQAYYEKAENSIEGMEFVGEHQADFFGRKTSVKFPNGKYGLCLVPPPDFFEDSNKEVFRSFQYTAKQAKLPVFAPHLKSVSEEALVLVQGGVINHTGRSLLNVRHYLLDKRLGNAYTEQILMEVARALAKLHSLITNSGKKLYHGFILPRSLFLSFDVNRTINNIVIADLGVAFSIVPKKIIDGLMELKKGTLPIEKYRANELLEQLSMMAPEQKEASRFMEVGAASDFFSFAALAIWMFTQKRFMTVEKVEWKLVPKKWRPFLKACLLDEINKRPKDFMELEDWLADPELALLHEKLDKEEVRPLGEDEELALEKMEIQDLTTVLQRVKKERVESTAQKFSTKGKKKKKHKQKMGSFDKGVRNIKEAKWEEAKVSFLEVLEREPEHIDANIELAIAFYELGDLDKAKEYYEKAKELNPVIAKKFRKHIAFKV